MSAPRWHEQPIGRSHDRNGFDCGSPDLNLYLARYARQNHDSGGAKTFVAASVTDQKRIFGYYSISPGGIADAHVPPSLTRGLGCYAVPVFRLRRLAVALDMQGHRLGSALLFAAGRRALAVATEVGGVALAIDAKDDRAAGWYERFGALRLLDDKLHLVMPLATIADALGRG